MSDLTVELETVKLEKVIDMARGLSPLEKVRLVEEVMTLLHGDLSESKPGPKRSLYGILPNTGLTEEDIAEVRKEMWGNFPREDI